LRDHGALVGGNRCCDLSQLPGSRRPPHRPDLRLSRARPCRVRRHDRPRHPSAGALARPSRRRGPAWTLLFGHQVDAAAVRLGLSRAKEL